MNIAVMVQKFGNFDEWVDFAYWWSCIWKGLRLDPGQQACFPRNPKLIWLNSCRSSEYGAESAANWEIF